MPVEEKYGLGEDRPDVPPTMIAGRHRSKNLWRPCRAAAEPYGAASALSMAATKALPCGEVMLL